MASTAASLKIEAPKPGVIVTDFGGFITADLLRLRAAEWLRALSGTSTRHWIMDASRIEGFQPMATPVGAEWIRTFKAQGGQNVYLIATLPAARMVVVTLGFAVGLPLKLCASRAEALALVP